MGLQSFEPNTIRHKLPAFSIIVTGNNHVNRTHRLQRVICFHVTATSCNCNGGLVFQKK